MNILLFVFTRLGLPPEVNLGELLYEKVLNDVCRDAELATLTTIREQFGDFAAFLGEKLDYDNGWGMLQWAVGLV